MVEFALPKNSKITGGKTWPKPANATETREFKVYRWNPDDGKNPSVDTYYIDIHDCGPMVLDALVWIKNHIDPTLTFRRSCREGVCGSCSMNIDATNTLACTKATAAIKGAVKIYPLPHMPVVKDPVPDLANLHAPHAALARSPRAPRPPTPRDRHCLRPPRGPVPLLPLPHQHELRQGLPEEPQSGQGHRRDQVDDGRAPNVIHDLI